jgi:AbrB family looped-hinge helix DNA binding protein
MKEFTATITSKGQITIPREVRRELGVSANDQLVFVVQNGEVRLHPVEYTLESVRSSLPPLPGISDDFEREIEEAMEEEADRIMRRLDRP